MFWIQGAKISEKSFAPPKAPFCTGAKAVLGGAKDFSEIFAPWVQKTSCTLPYALLGIFPFRSISRPAASQL